MPSKEFSSKEFDSIGLVKKHIPIKELYEKADKLNIHVGFLAVFYEKMIKITEKFLEIEKRLLKIEAGRQ